MPFINFDSKLAKEFKMEFYGCSSCLLFTNSETSTFTPLQSSFPSYKSKIYSLWRGEHKSSDLNDLCGIFHVFHVSSISKFVIAKETWSNRLLSNDQSVTNNSFIQF